MIHELYESITEFKRMETMTDLSTLVAKALNEVQLAETVAVAWAKNHNGDTQKSKMACFRCSRPHIRDCWLMHRITLLAQLLIKFKER